MKIRLFFDKTNFVTVTDITTFTFVNGTFWYMNKFGATFTIKGVVGVGSC